MEENNLITDDEIVKRIDKANKEIKPFIITRNQKQKDGSYKKVETKYAEVSERILAFRKVYPKGKLVSEPTFTENYVMFETRAFDGEGNLLAVAHARKYIKSNYAYEVAETSAYGRCIGLCGIGVKGGLATADDVQGYEDEQIFDSEQMEKDKKRKEQAITKFNKLGASQKANILNLFHTSDVTTISTDVLEDLVRNAKWKQ